MRSPQAFRNGDTPSPHFHNTVTLRKLRRFNTLILVFRVTAFTFSFASSVFMVTNSRGSDSPHWFDFDAFRFRGNSDDEDVEMYGHVYGIYLDLHAVRYIRGIGFRRVLFLGLSSLLSGFRVVCFIINGSRFIF
ncbi:hypothetical protein F3Y22_tig00110020pilonHSYRG00440 [Hibiscus syriacus]|uniref:CASP-like protein n=1 Tax=Hibiscus syriacus TaxID=106335 RepID=A0A6A3BPJ4_HIBSY|nr:CASP-like protein 4C1 [Hibiscus syriacus]KAE8718007.1 hypothetical protein F3Y22_tig00110020pilonHSYRG00440 [Hibiscus syriacus]